MVPPPPFTGEPSGVKCSKCGADTARYAPGRDGLEAMRKKAGEPRYSKKRRCRIKHHKTWADANRFYLIKSMAIGAMGPPRFKCLVCGVVEGFYSAVGRSVFTVTPL